MWFCKQLIFKLVYSLNSVHVSFSNLFSHTEVYVSCFKLLSLKAVKTCTELKNGLYTKFEDKRPKDRLLRMVP